MDGMCVQETQVDFLVGKLSGPMGALDYSCDQEESDSSSEKSSFLSLLLIGAPRLLWYLR